MKLTKRKMVDLLIIADALLITMPLIVVEVLTSYYQSNGMPLPHSWWFVPYSMGLGLLIFLSLIALDVWQSVKKWFSRDKE
jgi:hypothetical protein